MAEEASGGAVRLASLLVELRALNEQASSEPPSEVIRLFHTGQVTTGAGVDGLPFLVWFFAANDARYVTTYAYQILRLARDSTFTDLQLKTMTRNFLRLPTEFISFCGLGTLWTFVDPFLRDLEAINERDVLLEWLGEIQLYSAHLNAWIHHFFRWNLAYRAQEQVAFDVHD